MALKLEDFWDHVERGRPDECWPWLGKTVNGYGYATLTADAARSLGLGKTQRSHRLALIISRGQGSAPRTLACHKCNNPICCNPTPAHVYWGSNRDNYLDAVRAGVVRPFGKDWPPTRGRGASPLPKLLPEQVEELRREYPGRTWGWVRRMARRYGVTDETVQNAVRGRRVYKSLVIHR